MKITAGIRDEILQILLTWGRLPTDLAGATPMKMTQVTSSNIAAIGYHQPFTALFVEFKNGKTFSYCDVSMPNIIDWIIAFILNEDE